MKYLDMQGAPFPALGFGTWRLDGGACVDAVKMALDMGYHHIDTAQVYGNEAEVGQAASESGIDRKALFITTKLWTTNFTSDRVASSMEESLERLRTEYVDLLLMHWPNPEVPLSETFAAMRELMRKGKARAIGVSNFPVSLMREAVEKHGAPVACNQVEYHALLSQHAVLGYARAHNIIVTAYRPLARPTLAHHPMLQEIGRRYGKTAAQIALRWLIQQEGVAVIPKAASGKHARSNFEIFDFSLSESDMRMIAALSNNTRSVNPDFAPQWDAA